MTEPTAAQTPSSGRLPLVLAAVVCLAIVAVVVALVARGDDDGFTALYGKQSEALNRRWERPPDPPDWTLVDGDAASSYRAAWAEQDKSRTLSSDPASNAFNLVAPDHRPGPALTVPEAGPVPSSCAALGIGADTDPALRFLDEQSCAAMAGKGPLLLAEGTYRKDSSSPARVWDTWGIARPGDTPNFVPFLRLAKLHALLGWTAHLRGDTDRLVTAVHELHRFGQDIGRGSSLLGAMVGTAIDLQAARMLRRMLRDRLLTGPQAALLHRQYAYADAERLRLEDVFAGEFLVMLPALMDEDQRERVDIPPTAILDAGLQSPGVLAWYWRESFAALHFAFWQDILSDTPATWAARDARYMRWEQEFDSSINPLAQIGGGFLAQYDLKLTMAQAHDRMLQIALADYAYTAEHGEPAGTLETLSEAGFAIPVDPLTQAPFELTATEGKRQLHSTCPPVPRMSAWTDDEALLTLELTGPPPPAPAEAVPNAEAPEVDSAAPEKEPAP